MVAAVDTLKSKLKAAGTADVTRLADRRLGDVERLQHRQPQAMMKSELISWPVTLAILVLAFGSLAAAGLPLLLTILGLVASAGLLTVLTHGFEISIWAMNFALMFALALGIDYALFVVNRFRGAFFGSRSARDAVAVTMDTAGKAVLFSGLTVLISLSAVMLVPSPAFRSMALGIMLSVVFVLAATLTLLPAVLAKLGPKVDALPLRWVHSGEHRSARFARWGERLWRHPHVYGPAATLILVLLALPIFGLKTGMPSIKVVPSRLLARRLHAGAASLRCRRPRRAPARRAARRRAVSLLASRDPGIARVTPAAAGSRRPGPGPGDSRADPSNAAVGDTIDRLRGALPPRPCRRGGRREPRSRAGARGEDAARDRGRARARLPAPARRPPGPVDRRPRRPHEPARDRGGLWRRAADLPGRPRRRAARLRVAGLSRRLGAGVLLRDDLCDLDGLHRLPALLGEGALRPDRRPTRGVDGGLAHSGRVIFAAAAVMVAVFFTFALSGPLPPKEMGVILGVAVLLDAMLVRLMLIPTLLRVFGHWAWTRPGWLDRILPNVRSDTLDARVLADRVVPRLPPRPRAADRLASTTSRDLTRRC